MKKLILLALFASLFSLTAEPPLATGSAASPTKQRGAGHRVGQSSVQLASDSPSYLILPTGAFTSDGSAPGGFYIDSDFGYLHGIGDPTNMWAPFYPPPGTAITSLEVFLEDWDSEPNHDVCVYLDRMELATGTYQCCLAGVCSTGMGSEYGVLIDETIVDPVVSDGYAYQVNIYGLYPETYIYGVRLGYGSTEFLPAVVNEAP